MIMHVARPPTPAPGLAEVQGLWRRLWLRAPGQEDATTEVHWLQAGALHVDLRLPAGLPSDALAPADLDAAGLRAIARAEGFAGVTSVERGVCTWTRRINWRGPLDGPDVGALFFEDGDLMERGVFADYAELWRRVETPSALARPTLSARQLRRADGQLAIAVRAGDRFLLGRAAPEALAASGSLAARLELALSHRHRGALKRLFDMEFCRGRVTPEGGRIERSTQPGRKGALAFGPDLFSAEETELSAIDFDGTLSWSAWVAV